jgi:3-hydroxyacyl-CoA dehydrogenase
MSSSRYDLHGDVAVITLDNPPVNGLGHALRRGISAGLERAQDDDAVRAIVLIGSAQGFSGGADVKEFGTALAAAAPNLRALVSELEEMSKPVIAAIAGIAMGGGLELALGCHYRVAAPGARIALPEVKLGLLPGAGGTQRLPRVIGLERALSMIVSGTTVLAAELSGTQLFDRIIDGELLAGAVGFAREIAAVRPLPRVRDLSVQHPNAQGFLGFARTQVKALAKNLLAPPACVAAVAASLGDFEQGLTEERALFAQLIHSPESAALRHAFFAERAAAKIPGVGADVAAAQDPLGRRNRRGHHGRRHRDELCERGHSRHRARCERGGAREGARRRASQLRERRAQGQALIRRPCGDGTRSSPERSMRRISSRPTSSSRPYSRISKPSAACFRSSMRSRKPGAILASNTSTLDIDRNRPICTRRPADVLGLHFFSPANVMRLLEIVRGKATSAEVLASALALAKKLNKVGVVAGVCDGFIGNRMLRPYLRQVELLLLEGALPAQVDGALERWGWAMGPCRMADLAGNDIAGFIRRRQYADDPDAPHSPIADRLVELGRFGQKSGKGYYRYAPGGREPLADPEVERIILDAARGAGLTRRSISADEIVKRCMFALVNEGAKILEEGIAARASDIDVVYLTGYGFPLFRGGPMFYADTIGLAAIVRALRRFAANPASDPGFWTPAALLARLAVEGTTFNA